MTCPKSENNSGNSYMSTIVDLFQRVHVFKQKQLFQSKNINPVPLYLSIWPTPCETNPAIKFFSIKMR